MDPYYHTCPKYPDNLYSQQAYPKVKKVHFPIGNKLVQFLQYVINSNKFVLLSISVNSLDGMLQKLDWFICIFQPDEVVNSLHTGRIFQN